MVCGVVTTGRLRVFVCLSLLQLIPSGLLFVVAQLIDDSTSVAASSDRVSTVIDATQPPETVVDLQLQRLLWGPNWRQAVTLLVVSDPSKKTPREAARSSAGKKTKENDCRAGKQISFF